MAENLVCEIFNSVLKNKLNKHATKQSEKLSDLKKTTIRAIKAIWTQINVNEIVTYTRCGFSVPSLSTKLSKKQVYKLKRRVVVLTGTLIAKEPICLNHAF